MSSPSVTFPILLLALIQQQQRQQFPFTLVTCEPLSRPYVAHFTSPWDQSIPLTTSKKTRRNPNSSSFMESEIQWKTKKKTGEILQSSYYYNSITYVDIQKASATDKQHACPIDFSMGFSTTTTNHSFVVPFHNHHPTSIGIHSSPVLFPIHPADTPGKSILFVRDYDYLDMITPTRYYHSSNAAAVNTRDVLTRDDQFPLLFEQSMFGYNIYPLIQDVDSDGIPEAILVDYDGAINVVGLDTWQNTNKEKEDVRFFHQRQIPRLIIRKDWVQHTLNQTSIQSMIQYGLDPYHSFFEYNSDAETITIPISQSTTLDTIQQDKVHVFRGIRGDLLDLSIDIVQIQKQEQERMANHKEEKHRRLQEIPREDSENDISTQQQEENKPSPRINQREGMNYYGDDMMAGYDVHHHQQQHTGDDYYPIIKNHQKVTLETNEVIMKNQFYNDENYIHLPPHVLTTPTYAEIPSRYKSDRDDIFSVEELLLIPVSYFIDEEEYIGHQRYKRFQNVFEDKGDDMDLSQRGQYVASALIIYDLINQRFLSNIHLDLSTDDTTIVSKQSPSLEENDNYTKQSWDDRKIGAFAMASPTVADLDGDGVMEALIGTSMGIVYSLSLPYGYRNLGFPVQMKYPVEQPILVEDVMGDRDLEVFIIDSGGNIVCLDHKGGTYWHRALLHDDDDQDKQKIIKTSSMMMGDVNGDGYIDIVVTVLISRNAYPYRALRIYVIDARDGKDINFFPQEIQMEGSESYLDDYIATIPNPLLVDLHARSKGSSWKHVISQASKTSATRKGRITHGGISPGLHIVQPLQSMLYIIEGGSGCCNAKNMNFEVHAMAQIDDMHGTETLDLVLTSTTGDVYTLDLPDVVPYHPLNVHPRPGVYVHGSSASAGIFVHNMDRKYRDVLGVVFYITLEVFDRKSIDNQGGDNNKYYVEIRDGPSARRKIFKKIYNRPGVYPEKIYIPYGPGYYTLCIRMKTNHGLIYEDVIHLGYNVNYSVGLTSMLIFPIIAAIISIIFLSQVKRIDTEPRPILLR